MSFQRPKLASRSLPESQGDYDLRSWHHPPRSPGRAQRVRPLHQRGLSCWTAVGLLSGELSFAPTPRWRTPVMRATSCSLRSDSREVPTKRRLFAMLIETTTAVPAPTINHMGAEAAKLY